MTNNSDRIRIGGVSAESIIRGGEVSYLDIPEPVKVQLATGDPDRRPDTKATLTFPSWEVKRGGRDGERASYESGRQWWTLGEGGTLLIVVESSTTHVASTQWERETITQRYVGTAFAPGAWVSVTGTRGPLPEEDTTERDIAKGTRN